VRRGVHRWLSGERHQVDASSTDSVDGHREQELHAARWQEGIHRRRSMMDYAYLFSGMGVTILFLAWKLFHMTGQRNHYRRVITGIGLGRYSVKVHKYEDRIDTEIEEV
jgi:hypothetical protein